MERVKRSFYWKCENVGRFILRSAWNVGTNLYIFCSATIRFSSGKEMPIIFPAPPTPKALRRLWRLLSKMNIWFFSCRTGSTQIPRMASYRQQLWLIQNLIKIFSFHYGRMKIHKIAIKGVLRSLSRGWAFCIVVFNRISIFRCVFIFTSSSTPSNFFYDVTEAIQSTLCPHHTLPNDEIISCRRAMTDFVMFWGCFHLICFL